MPSMMACTPPNPQPLCIGVEHLTSVSQSERLKHVCRAAAVDPPNATLSFLRCHFEHAVTLFALCDALFGPEDTSADCCFVALDFLARTVVVYGRTLMAPKSTALTIAASLIIGWKFISRDADVEALVNAWNHERFLGGVHLDVREVAWQEWELLEAHTYRVATPNWWFAGAEVASMFWGCDGGTVEGSTARLPDITNGHGTASLRRKQPPMCIEWQRLRARFSLLLVTMQTLLLQYGQGIYSPSVSVSVETAISQHTDVDLMWAIMRDACSASGVAPPSVIASLLPRTIVALP